MNVKIQTVKVGTGFVAFTELAGMRLRGKRANDQTGAVRNLFWKLAGEDHDDEALMAIELALGDTTLDAQLSLGEGGGTGG